MSLFPREQAQEYFDEKYQRGEGFLKHATYAYDDKDYKLSSFMLHQVIENLYPAIILTFTLYTKKEHNLEKLSGLAKSHSLKSVEHFPRNTAEGNALSYTEAEFDNSKNLLNVFTTCVYNWLNKV